MYRFLLTTFLLTNAISAYSADGVVLETLVTCNSKDGRYEVGLIEDDSSLKMIFKAGDQLVEVRAFEKRAYEYYSVKFEAREAASVIRLDVAYELTGELTGQLNEISYKPSYIPLDQIINITCKENSKILLK